jgi:hypothetical protein
VSEQYPAPSCEILGWRPRQETGVAVMMMQDAATRRHFRRQLNKTTGNCEM